MQNREYKKLSGFTGITGHIINLHDPINFDIDLQLTEEQQKIYQSVVKRNYCYVEYDDQLLFENGDITLKQQTGTTYRCHLRGIMINKNCHSVNILLSNIKQKVEQLLRFNDRRVICSLSDIDIYSRILVNISIPKGEELIDLREYLLSQDTGSLFNVYY